MTVSRLASARRILPVVSVLLIGQAVIVSGVIAAPSHRPGRSTIASVTLTTADISGIYGKGFRSFINGVISNKALLASEKTAGVSATTTGRVTGYESVWFRGNKTASLSVTNAVSEYRSSSFPHMGFSQMGKVMQGHKGFTVHFTPLKGLGDEAAVVTMRSHGTTTLGIAFRRGKYLAEIMVGRPHGTVRLSEVTKLATIEDQRIQSHG
jgi:hypothetical protein